MSHFLGTRLLKLDLKLLIRAQAFFADEILDGFDKTDLVIQTARSHNSWSHTVLCLSNCVCEACAFFRVAILLLLFQFDGVNEGRVWVLQDDELVGNYAVNDFLLFELVDVVDVLGFMQLSLTAMVALLALQDLVNAHGFIAAAVLVLGAKRIGRHLDLGSGFVESALAHLGDRVILHATVTFDEVQIRPNLPVDFFPGDAVCFSDKGNELLKVPILVNYVLGSHLAVGINETGALAAAQHLALLFGEKLVAVSTLVEVVFLFL